ncbi:MAG: hypothetical protein WC868_02710 [Bacteroidales bacterium]
MKTTIKKIGKMVLCLMLISNMNANAQLVKKTVGILNIYSRGVGLYDEEMGNLLRSEVEKLDSFSVIDRFDMNYLIKQKNLNADCNSKLCLIEVGKIVNAEKMFSGSVEKIGEKIIITLRLIDVKAGTIEKTQVNEFLNLPAEIKSMLNIAVSEMFGKKTNETLKTKLAKKYDYDNAINNPTVDRLNCSGTRMGVTFFTGNAAKIISAPKNQGGYDGYPAMFQFGYQLEQQYLNEGSFQALFEFIPMITGLDQGLCIPSLTIMNGLRNNKNGWEFAFGPTFLINKASDSYYQEGQWRHEHEWNNDSIPNPYPIVSRMDSRGHAKLTTGFVFAFGKTIKSGNLNIPINAFIIPNKEGIRFGISFGYNSKKR